MPTVVCCGSFAADFSHPENDVQRLNEIISQISELQETQPQRNFLPVETLLKMVKREELKLVFGGTSFYTIQAVARINQIGDEQEKGGKRRLLEKINTYFFGGLSLDELGEQAIRLLGDAGVDTSMVVRCEEPSKCAIDVPQQGGGFAYHFIGSGYTLKPEDLPADSQLPEENAQVWVFGGSLMVQEPGATVWHTLAQRVKERESAVYYDINVRLNAIKDRAYQEADSGGKVLLYQQAIERWLKLADVVKASHDDINTLYPDLAVLPREEKFQEVARRYHEMGCEIVFITDGEEGAWVSSKTHGREAFFSPSPLRTHYAVGAGDNFNGAAAASIAHYLNEKEAIDDLDWSQIVSAMETGVYGARRHLMSNGAIEMFNRNPRCAEK